MNCCKLRLLLHSRMKFLLCFPTIDPLGLRLSKKKQTGSDDVRCQAVILTRNHNWDARLEQKTQNW